jgi:iron complex outermembrane recepter protein
MIENIGAHLMQVAVMSSSYITSNYITSNYITSNYITSNLMTLMLLLFLGFPLYAADESKNDFLEDISLEELSEIRLTGAVVRELGLNKGAETGSRIGLRLMDQPVSIDIINHNTMKARGLKSVTEASDNLVGVISGESPAEPSSFSMRGFSRDSVNILRDGISTGPASIMMRPQNTFNLEKVEILKGPASLHHAAGTASGAINIITKKPVLGSERVSEAFISYGRYNTIEWGLGQQGSLGENKAYRIDVNRSQSSGWVDRTDSFSLNITAALAWQATDDLKITYSLDYLDDDLPSYWGTPLVAPQNTKSALKDVIESNDGRILDSTLRFKNYNVSDQKTESDQWWGRVAFQWSPRDHIVVNDTVYYFTADRIWRNSEAYLFNATPTVGSNPVIERDRFYISHDIDFFGNQFTIKIENTVGEMDNTLVVGFEYKKTEFTRGRFSAGGDSVDPVSVDPGLFGIVEPTKGLADIENIALVFEDSLKINSQWRLTGGLRYEQIDLERNNFDAAGNFDANTSFAQKYEPLSFILGIVYSVNENISVYGHWSAGQDPAGSNLLLANAGQDVDFADVTHAEIGLKSMFSDGKHQFTIAYYDIEREGILLLSEEDSAEAFNNTGIQESYGVEFALITHLTQTTKIGGNISFINSEYVTYIDPDLEVDATGNTPPNTPDWIANLWLTSTKIAGMPLEIGGGLRYIDDRFANFENNTTLKSYLLVNAFVAYNFPKYRLSINLRNVFDEDYAPWADIFYPDQVSIGSPRAAELTFYTKF